MGWFSMRSILQSIEMAKSTDPEAIAKSMTEWSLQEGDLRVRYRDFDHQLVRRTLVCEVKPKITDKWDFLDVKAALPRTPSELEAAFGTPEQIGCKMDAT